MIFSEGTQKPVTLGRNFLASAAQSAFLTGLSVVFLVQVNAGRAGTLRPYTVDADTLHLWHMNDQSVPVIDMGSDGMHLTALRNGATLGNVSYRGFGTALSTYDGGPDSAADAGHDAYLAARPLVNGSGNNVLMTYAGASGAFTFEALVRIDFDPEATFSTNSLTSSNHSSFMQIINLDADESTNRVCQFRLVPIGVLKGNTEPLLEFINLNKDKSPQSLTASIPTNGADAIKFGSWYHVAVTFDGDRDRSDDLKFYWTLVDPGRTKANSIGSGWMTNELPSGCSPDFAIGQTGRQSPVTPYPNQNFLGLIDEVRISGVARSETQMLFETQPIVASATATPAAEAAPTQPAPEKGKTSTREDKRSVEDGGNGRSNADNALIAGALVIIAGLLCWLVYVLRRLVFGGGKGAQTTALAKVVPADALQNAAAGFARGEESLISQAGYQSHHAQPRSNGSGSTTHFKQKTVIPVVEEVVVAERKEYETGAEPGFRGVMRRVGLEDLIQLECMNSKSTLLDIANEKLRGRIYIERGEIIPAVAGKLSGESALHKLLALRGGKFSLKPLEQPERRTIHGQWMQLLMEAAQLRDEETSFLTATEPKGFSFAPSTSTPEEIVAMATLLGEHPHVKELLVVAREGEVLYSSKCADVAGRATVCNDLLEAAKAVSTHLPLGDFHHVEIVNNQSRTVIQPAQGHHLLIGTPSDSPG